MYRLIALVAIMLALTSCGYVPSATYAQKALGERVYVELKVNLPNPENSVELKDLMNKIIISRFQIRVSSKEDADSIITVAINKIVDTTFALSSSAFTTYYRVNAYVTYTYDNKKGTKRTFEGSGYYDYNVSLDNPLTTYNNRYYAINQAFTQTVDQFVAQISFDGQK
ncbi:lipoprotein [Helicobacter canis]|uniref:Lipoprotein n=2 Tax=Helicobacter canis TaxID=29419 RepID=A0A377J2U3_9HELI|nr:lipoprotein [Helicobacter canis]